MQQHCDVPRTFFEVLHLQNIRVKHSAAQRKRAGKPRIPSDVEDESESRAPRETYCTIDVARDVMASGNVAATYVGKGYTALSPRFYGCDWPEGCLESMQVTSPTRPNLSDLVYASRKTLPRSGTPIDNAELNRVLPYFSFLDRTRAFMSEKIAAKLPPAHSRLADLRFHSYKSTLRCLDGLFQGERQHVVLQSSTLTFGFVLREYLWVNGPIGVMVWGPDAVATLLFSHLLRWRHPELLDGVGLSIVAFDGTVPKNTRSFDFLDDRLTTVVLDHAVTDVPPPATREEASRPAPFFGRDYIKSLMATNVLKTEISTIERRRDPYARATVELARDVEANPDDETTRDDRATK